MKRLALLLVLTLAGCGTATKNTITIKHAEQRVEDYFRKALAVLPEQAQPQPQLIDTYACDDPTDNGPAGRQMTSVNYRINNLNPDNYPDYFTDVEQWWKDHDFRVLDDERPEDQSIWVENNKDGFRMRITANEAGKLILIVSSPCVWPDGTPDD